MPRTDKEIAAYIEYFRTAPREERAWALERLAKQEGKTPAEIREICENYKGTNLRKGVPAPDELYERIQSQLRAGQSETQIMRDFGTSATTIAKAKQRMKKAEEKKPEPVKEEKPEPEGVYRQNFFENPPPEEREPIESITEKAIAGDCREKGKISNLEKSEVYYNYIQPLVDMIWEGFEKENPVVRTIEVNVIAKSASVGFKTDDGKVRVLKLMEV